MKQPFLIGLGLLVVIFAGLFFFSQRKQPSVTFEPFTFATTTVVARETFQAPKGWREYKNATYSFSLFYPQELAVSEYQEGGNATTITFQDTDKGLGFQIFVVPYNEQKISEERFRKDVPSGIRADLKNITIDGIHASSFSSKDVFLGETQEIWFIRNGFLYEITTPQTLGAWLSEIVLTWQFL